MRAFVAASALLLAIQPAFTEDVEVQGVLAMAKYAGFCGAVFGMISFQDSTQMPGGDAFLDRYLATEAARLGVTAKQLGDNCKKAISGYDRLYADAEKR
jgi:hypothetical protein